MEADYSDITGECWLCPLLSFNCYPEVMDLDSRPVSVKLANGIHIIRITPELTEYLYEHHPDWLDTISAEYIAVLPYKVAKRQEKTSVFTEIDAISNQLSDLITALRLCHAGVVAVGPLLAATVQGSKLYMLRQNPLAFAEILPDISKTQIDSASFGLSEYEFYLSDVPTVNKLMGEVCACRGSGKSGALDEALRRFNSAYDGRLEDRLIDQMIAFESLYIGDDKELGYKLSLRTAFLLGRRRTQIFNDMKKAYTLRGQLVHGNKRIGQPKLLETIPKSEEYLRQSIRRFLMLLSRGMSLSQIRDKLDENILKNGKPLALKV